MEDVRERYEDAETRRGEVSSNKVSYWFRAGIGFAAGAILVVCIAQDLLTGNLGRDLLTGSEGLLRTSESFLAWTMLPSTREAMHEVGYRIGTCIALAIKAIFAVGMAGGLLLLGRELVARHWKLNVVLAELLRAIRQHLASTKDREGEK